MEQHEAIDRVLRVKARYELELLKLPNVVGVGIGFKYKNGRVTEEVVLIVNVIDKKPLAELAAQDIIPAELEGVPVDVQEVGPMRAYEDW